ncbi:MAG: UDP-N-acetylmuramoyl-L-alanine--D-glutamate ligase [Acidimicrobiaceae bacterium]|nr:UDP-N-acetylmuramoyl-L-alanine--D-glutamate ligase [Acidimicrobiaceae bacterium]
MKRDIILEDATVGVFGLGETGLAVVDFLQAKNIPTLLFDDNPSDRAKKLVNNLGLDIHLPNSESDFSQLIETMDIFMPTPGLPDNHWIYEYIRQFNIPTHSEFDLAAQFDDRPLLAITGTNGKTTVTMMVKEMLLASGIKTEAVGNTGIPLIRAIQDPSIEKFVVEASSFRLAHSSCFCPEVSIWLNFSPDHLDVHQNLKTYENAKASIWKNHTSRNVAIGNAEDEVVMSHIPKEGSVKTFGKDSGDNKVTDGFLTVNNQKLIKVSKLQRASRHDILNALAAATVALDSGAEINAIKKVLAEFKGLPHRIAFIGQQEGVSWYNDSKSTTPHSVLAAVSGFENVILLAGGRNKGLDLNVLTQVQEHVKHLVAIGEAADEIEKVFQEILPISKANSMYEAIEIAFKCSGKGDVVLLSPGCTSFDWYGSYAERGEDFERIVQSLIGAEIDDN